MPIKLSHTSRRKSGTHKNLRSPCNLPNLFSCQISSSSTYVDLPALAGMSCSLASFRNQLKRREAPKTKLKLTTGAHPTQCSTSILLTPNIKLANYRAPHQTSFP